MSCNKENINRLSTVTVASHQFGRVTGQLVRLTGSAGYLTAICDRGYKFDGWYDTQSQLMSVDERLYIPSWMDMTVEPRFSEIIITVGDATAMDANESLVYYIEKHGQNKGATDSTYGMFPVQTYYSAGNFSTDSNNSSTRLMINGDTVCEYPVTYGYNYDVHSLDENGNPFYQINLGTYDENTNISTGTWYRDPATYEKKYEISIPDILSVPLESVEFPFQEYSRIPYVVGSCKEPTGSTYYNNGNFHTYNSPTDQSTPSQFPLLQYHRGINLINYYHEETLDFAGLEGGDFQSYYHRINSGSHKGSRIRNLDTVSEWKDFRAIGSYAYNWYMFDNNTLGHDDNSPRIIDPFVYNNNLTVAMFTGPGGSGTSPRTALDPDLNPQWTSNYQTKPKSGLYHHPLRYSLVTNMVSNTKTYVQDYTLTKNYFQTLRGVYDRQSNQTGSDIDLTGADFSNLTHFYFSCSDYVNTIEPLSAADDLKYFVMSSNSPYKILTLEPLQNKKIQYFSIARFPNLIHDSLYEERVKLHMDFNSNNILTQDSTRHVNKLNNHGAIVVDT